MLNSLRSSLYFFLWLMLVGPQFKTQSWLQLAPLCVGLHNWKQLVGRQSVISLSFSWCRCCCCGWRTFAWWHQAGQFGLHRLSGLWLWKDLMWSGGFGRGLGHRWSEGPKVIKGWGHPGCPFFLALKKKTEKRRKIQQLQLKAIKVIRRERERKRQTDRDRDPHPHPPHTHTESQRQTKRQRQ